MAAHGRADSGEVGPDALARVGLLGDGLPDRLIHPLTSATASFREASPDGTGSPQHDDGPFSVERVLMTPR